MAKDILDLLTLTALPGIGNSLARQLLATFGTAGNIIKAGSDVSKVPGIGSRLSAVFTDQNQLASIRQWARQEYRQARARNIVLLSQSNPLFPSQLTTIQDAPVLLYALGNLDVLKQPAVAIIGSRAATSYGKRISAMLAGDLARAGITIVSGLALGIDGHAHQGCLEAGGQTVAVLGCGIDVIYPRSHKDLYNDIIHHGLLLSEYPLTTRPEGYRFPARNRIISGLSMAVIVVEATPKSGSLITARLALDQGRDVFAVPGRIDSVKSAGTHRLIQQGAQLVGSASDVIKELAMIVSFSKQPSEVQKNIRQPSSLDSQEQCLLDCLDAYPVDIDTLALQTKIPAATLHPLLLHLEMKGLLRQLPGQQYERVS